MTAAGRPLLVFDGDCGFCTTSAMAAKRWFHLDHVEPWQCLDLDELGLTREACERAVQWVAEDGTVSAGERAVIEALDSAGGFWRIVGRVMALPGIVQLAGVVYRLVAKYRHRMPGGTPACKMPSTDSSADRAER